MISATDDENVPNTTVEALEVISDPLVSGTTVAAFIVIIILM